MLRAVFVLAVVALSGCKCRTAAPASLQPVDAGLPRSGQWRSGFTLADLDGDGRAELLHGPARKGTRRPHVWRATGDDALAELPLEFPPLAWDYGDVAALDADHLVFGTHLGATLAVARVDGGWRDDSAGLPTEGFSTRALAVGDWNHDGQPDVFALSDGPRPGVPGFKGLGVRVFERLDGGWVTETPRADDTRFGDDLVVADFDGDGRDDVATASHTIGEARLVDFGGAGRAVTALPLPPRSLVRAVAAADVDGDARAELFVVATVPTAAGFTSQTLRFDFDDGWKVQPLATQPVEQWALTVGDLTGDGAPDVVTGDDDGVLQVFVSARGAPQRLAVPAWRQGCRVTHLGMGALHDPKGLSLVASFALEDAPDRCPSQGGLEVLRWR